jgi:hypothetical protein
MTRPNPIAKSLRSLQCRQRVINGKRREAADGVRWSYGYDGAADWQFATTVSTEEITSIVSGKYAAE